MADRPFWQRKSLAELTHDEWESLCDGCGKCCLHKLEDEDTGEVFYTQVACKLLDLNSCRCSDYARRLNVVPGCVDLRPQRLEALSWLPSTCAYRLVAEKKPLPQWHHLMCGDRSRVHRDRQSVKGRVLSEAVVAEDDLEEHIVHWIT